MHSVYTFLILAHLFDMQWSKGFILGYDDGFERGVTDPEFKDIEALLKKHAPPPAPPTDEP